MGAHMAGDRPTRFPPPQKEFGASEAFAVLNFAQAHGISAEDALAIRAAAGADDEKAERMAGDLRRKMGEGTSPTQDRASNPA